MKTKKNFKNFTVKSVSKKKLSDFNETERDILRVISVLGGETMPVGSYRFKDHKYPGDIDLCEEIIEKGPLEIAKKNITDRIITGIRRILIHQPKTYLADFKAGEDTRFKDLKIDKNIDDKKINEIINKLKYIENDKIKIDKELYTILSEKLTDESVSTFNDKIHEYTIIRWDIDTLLARKIEKNGLIIKLEDALCSNTTVKFDIWYNNRDKYIEVTNYLILSYKHGNRKIYLTTEMGNLVETLLYDIKKYYNANNYLKCLKRIWSLLNNTRAITRDKIIKNKLKEYILLIAPIFKDNPAKISQIKADLEVVYLMSEKLCKLSKIRIFPADNILYTLLGIKNRLKGIINNDVNMLFKFTDYYRNRPATITLPYNNYWQKEKLLKFTKDINTNIPKIIQFIDDTVNKQSLDWLKDHDINLNKVINDLETISKKI